MDKDLTATINYLYDVIAGLTNRADCERLFADLCTYKEIEQMASRVKAAKLLLEGRTYAEVIAETNISSATLSRVSRCIQHGSGGYRDFAKLEK